MIKEDGNREAGEPAQSEGTQPPPGNQRKQGARWIMKLVVPCLVLVGAVFGAMGLAALRQPPAHKDLEERALKVRVVEVTPSDVPVMIAGYGTVESLDVVRVAPEVSGNITSIHPNLEVGEVIPEGELLFMIDQRNYRANLAQARAQVAQAENALARLKQQEKIDRERLVNQRRSAEIAETEYKRVRTLFEDNDVGTQSGVDQAEIGLNNARDARDRLEQAVAIYPISIEEAAAGLEAARAAVDLAEANLERTEVKAPFDARIRMVQLEVGQFVSPGNAVMTLANDTMLELSVPLDSRDVRQWMQFEETDTQVETAWFGEVRPVDCRITWTESGDTQHWVGQLHRIEAFDPMTRTVTVAVRVSSADARAGTGRLPMVDGMFCSVEIPGRELTDVYELPRWAVDFEGYVYLADADNRLRRQEVTVARNQGESAYVSEGLNPGDRVVVTRLVNPLPNTRLEIVESAEEPTPPDEQEAVL